MNPTRQPRCGATLIEVLVVVGIIGTLVGLTLAGVQRVRGRAAGLGCQNQLRQVALALGNYHAAYGRLPAGVTATGGPDGVAYLGWLPRLLPYVEQDAVWQQAVAAAAAEPDRFSASPPHPFANAIPVYGCPADARTKQPAVSRDKLVAVGSYLGVAGSRHSWNNGVLYFGSRTRLTDITDGASNTLAVGERPPSPDLWFGWWYAGLGVDRRGTADTVLGVRERATVDHRYMPDCGTGAAHFRAGDDSMCDAMHFWSLHPGGSHFAFADGSVRFLRYEADPIMPALATRAGGEPATVPD